jgi:hypothetical protein
VTHRQPFPTVVAVLDRGKYSWIWVVPSCPYCGKAHAHYGGPLDHDPYYYLAYPMTATCTMPGPAALLYLLQAEPRTAA